MVLWIRLHPASGRAESLLQSAVVVVVFVYSNSAQYRSWRKKQEALTDARHVPFPGTGSFAIVGSVELGLPWNQDGTSEGKLTRDSC